MPQSTKLCQEELRDEADEGPVSGPIEYPVKPGRTGKNNQETAKMEQLSMPPLMTALVLLPLAPGASNGSRCFKSAFGSPAGGQATTRRRHHQRAAMFSTFLPELSNKEV